MFEEGYIIPVSIHAPAWGATESICGMRRWNSGFNPRPRMGGDGIYHEPPIQHIGFNPRPRMGGDLSAEELFIFWMSFNPRPRMGGDIYLGAQCENRLSFNPRPRMGGDAGHAPGY